MSAELERAREELAVGELLSAAAVALVAIAAAIEAELEPDVACCECEAQNSDYAFGCPVHGDDSLEDPAGPGHPDWVPTESQMAAARHAIGRMVTDVALAREQPSEAVLNEIILTVVLAIRKQR